MNKHLVVFGCGYIGSAVAKEALRRGLRVTALTRNPAKAAVLRRDGIDVVVADVSTSNWHGCVPEAEFVLNCVSSGGGGIEGYRNSYVGGMQSVLEWMKVRGMAGTFVYTSSTSVYPQTQGEIVDESATTGGSERADILLQAESVLKAAPRNIRPFILRLAGIYGPSRHQLLNQVRAGEIAGQGDYRLNLAHRDDIAAAIWACFTAPATISGETFNVADDVAWKKAEIAQWLASQLGVPPPVFTGKVTSGRREQPTDRQISNARLKARLEWRPGFPTFREGYATLLSR